MIFGTVVHLNVLHRNICMYLISLLFVFVLKCKYGEITYKSRIIFFSVHLINTKLSFSHVVRTRFPRPLKQTHTLSL